MRWVTNLARTAAVRALRRAGWQLHPVAAGPATMEEGLAAFAERIEVATVVDVGASNGSWTEVARRYWPDAHYLLLEAQRAPHEAALAELRRRVPRLDYVIAAAGDRAGTIHFDASDPFGGAASRSGGGGRIEVPMTTVDAEVERRSLPGPYAIKLDTHGFEVPILDGARRTLASASLLVVEVYNFRIAEGALRFPDMCRHLEGLGFRPIAMVDLMYRKKDGVLWQCDCFFARADRAEFRSDEYE
jgi:FkbM family methyltransferase